MAVIQHVDIPDGERHEPKGIATATSGQIYVADGATSGVWTNASDAIASGGVLATNGLSVPDTKSLDFLPTSYVKVGGGDGWKDLTGQISVRGTGVNDPAWTQITGSTSMWAFQFSAATMMQFWIAFHINHDYALGTAIYPHVHWINAAAAPNTGNVRWGFEYAVAKGHNQQAFPMLATTTVYVTQACPATRYYHNIAELALADAIPSTNLEVDSIVYMRIFRDAADVGDTCTDAVFLLAADCHYQSNTIATKNKSPNFYT